MKLLAYAALAAGLVSNSSTTTSVSVDPALPAGELNLQTPVTTSSTYVKSGDLVTFGWNYTDLILSPSAINIAVSCSQNKQVYTLAQNQSVQTSSIVWDTNKAGESGGLHLISAEYTLMIYDASKTPTSIASAGELTPFTFSFGVYVPQSYTSWPFAAKYVNISVKLTPPAICSLVLGVFGIAFVYLI